MAIDLTRRKFITITGCAGGFALLQGTLSMRFAFAATPQDKRLLVVILRGALDGLAAVAPVGDPAYADARGPMALPQNDTALMALDGYFALHRSMAPLMPLYQQKQLLIYHATATPYRERSHFDAQDLLENGTDKPHALATGWLSRVVDAMPINAMALGAAIPLMLRGNARVGSWAPSVLPEVDDDYLMRVMHMYQSDPLLLNALTSAEAMQSMGSDRDGRTRGGQQAFKGMMQKAAAFMAPANGVKIATVEIGGWDTHANQGLATGRLANNLGILSEGLMAFRQGMDAAWKDTAILCVTEFGRTVKGNGTGGTDHGTAGVAFLLGGSANGGRVIGDWPGLRTLYEGRDLMPANDLRALLKSTLQQHLALAPEKLDTTIFPGSAKHWLNEKLFA